MYIIDETSREYTVQSDSMYILKPDDLTGDLKQQFEKEAEDFVNEKIEAVVQATDKASRYKLLALVSPINEGTLYAGVTNRISNLEITGLDSAYVGLSSETEFGKTTYYKRMYYFFNADISYYIKDFTVVYEEDTSCAFAVQIDDPKIVNGKISYSKISFEPVKSSQAAYNKFITSKFEEIL